MDEREIVEVTAEEVKSEKIIDDYDSNNHNDNHEWKKEYEIGPRKSGSQVFWGILLVVAALALLTRKTAWFGAFGWFNFLGGINIFKLIFTVLMIVAMRRGIKEREFGGILIPAALIIIINAKLLHLEAITPWPVLGAAILGSIGLGMLFPKKSRSRHMDNDNWNREKQHVTKESKNGKYLKYSNNFGGSVKYVNEEFATITVENTFGSMELYLTDASLENNTGVVEIKNTFGETVIYVPKNWKTVINTGASFGEVNEQGYCEFDGVNVLYLTGNASFGEASIRHI